MGVVITMKPNDEATYEFRSDLEHRIVTAVASGMAPDNPITAGLLAEWKQMDNQVKASMGLAPSWADDGSMITEVRS